MEQKNVHHSFCPLRLLGHALYRFVSLPATEVTGG